MALTRVYGNLITSGTITGSLFNNNTITGDKIAPGTITSNLFATGAVDLSNISATTVNVANNLLVTGVYNGGYNDGIVMDYTTGTGRITVGSADGISLYNGGPNNRSLLLSVTTTGSISSNSHAVGVTTPAIANTTLDVYGGVAMNVVTLDTTSNTINVALANYFIVTPTGTTTFVFTGAPVSRDSSFVIELTNGGAYTITFPSSVKWPANTTPTLTASGKDLLIFSTANTGSTWRASSLIGYTA